MNASARCEYLSALGVPDFLYAQRKISAVEKISIQCLVVENVSNNSFCQSGKTQDFLLKMLAAIGLSASNVALINLSQQGILQNYNAKIILTMGSVSSVKADFNTHHPAQILNNDSLKREAWEVLKKIQKCLK